MPQPLDPAVQALHDSTPRAPFVLPDPPPSAAEMALAIRARDRPAAPAPVDEFHGTITERMVPVRWGSVPSRVYRPHSAEARLPAVAFFHGGGFIGGDLDSHDRLCRELA